MEITVVIVVHSLYGGKRFPTVYGHRIAFVDEPDQPTESWGTKTYAQMAELARAQAAGLDALGVPQGARVAIVSQNSARLLTSFFGVSAYGRVLTPINFRLVANEVAYIIENCGAEVLLVDPELESSLAGVKAKHRFVIGAESDQVLYKFGVEPQPWVPDEDATATINYTSGTTARPKGVQLTHRNLWLNAATIGWHLGVDDRETYLHTLPQFHCNGWGMLYAVTAMGGKHIVLRKVDGGEILKRVGAHGVTLMCGAPAVAAVILDAAAVWSDPIPGRDTTRIVVAGAPPPVRMIERVETDLGWQFHQIYGLTESSPLLTINSPSLETDGMSTAARSVALSAAGAPALGVETRIDATGEVWARSNVVMHGYWAQPEETAKALVDGWFRTGDGGSINASHVLTISDRKKDVIISGGENVGSIEVENAVFSHPDVLEVAVIGVPDAKWGELVMALVVKKAESPLTEAELIAYVKTKLAGYKCPKKVEFRNALARTTTGKLQKFKLRAPYWEGFMRQVN